MYNMLKNGYDLRSFQALLVLAPDIFEIQNQIHFLISLYNTCFALLISRLLAIVKVAKIQLEAHCYVVF